MGLATKPSTVVLLRACLRLLLIRKKGANGKGKAGREWQGWRLGGPVAAPAFEGTFVSRREEGRGNVMQARDNFRNRCPLYYCP